MTQAPIASGEKRRLLQTLGGAGAVAAALLVFAVLPAEFGIDPTGVGGALGLTRLAPANAEASRVQDIAPARDAVAFTLAPFESLELKYVGDKGAAIIYEWSGNGPLHYDFHGEQEGAEEGTALSFGRGDAAARAGQIVLPFEGEHGWFWENRTDADITVEIEVAGFFTEGIVYRDGGRFVRPAAREDAGGPPGEGATR